MHHSLKQLGTWSRALHSGRHHFTWEEIEEEEEAEEEEEDEEIVYHFHTDK